MSQIAVRLSEDELRQLDSIVRQSGFRTRAEAIRAGIRRLGVETREQRIALAYSRAYQDVPLSDDERQMLDAASALAADFPQ
ncbi:MAG TPA: ribbon-helix-helix domain-containing protein [Solirubrobacteraceae bacterium]|nr:ribbon-helix-helix domain-containing protein [Solirubrobacteraceae bacterium]